MTTKEELDAALATADQITVEGDDELLSYAVNKAAGEPENRIAVELPSLLDRLVEEMRSATPEERARYEVKAALVEQLIADEATARPKEQPTPTVAAGRASPPVRRAIIIAAAVLIAFLAIIAGAAVWLFAGKHESQLPVLDLPSGKGGETPEAASNVSAVLQSLAWPLVAIVAIVALFLIARQAISSGSNVTIVWKVTEKVSGKVVITKVREPAPRQRAAA